jgi:hypothetical protein
VAVRRDGDGEYMTEHHLLGGEPENLHTRHYNILGIPASDSLGRHEVSQINSSQTMAYQIRAELKRRQNKEKENQQWPKEASVILHSDTPKCPPAPWRSSRTTAPLATSLTLTQNISQLVFPGSSVKWASVDIGRRDSFSIPTLSNQQFVMKAMLSPLDMNDSSGLTTVLMTYSSRSFLLLSL